MRLRYDQVYSVNFKHVSEIHIFQNGTPCQSKTCFRLTHVLERRQLQAPSLLLKKRVFAQYDYPRGGALNLLVGI